MSYQGITARLGHAQETTFGTAVARDASLPVISVDLHRVIPRADVPRLYQSASSYVAEYYYNQGDRVEGTVVVEALYEGLGRFLEVAFRKNVSTSGSGPYDHVYMLGLGSTKPSLTLEKVWYDTATAGDLAEVYEGCYIPSWSYEVRTGQYAQWSFSVVGETSGGQTSATAIGSAPITTTVVSAYFNESGAITWNGNTIGLVRMMRVSCDHSMPVRMGLGSLNPKQPFPTGRARVQIELEIDWDVAAFNAGLSAGTMGDFAVVFTSGTKLQTWAGESCYIDSATAPVDTVGILTQRVVLIPRTDLTTEGLKLTIRNAQTSGVAG